MSKLDDIFNRLDEEVIEVHLMAGTVDCMHLTDNGKQAIKDLILELITIASDNNTRFIDPNQLRRMVDEL